MDYSNKSVMYIIGNLSGGGAEKVVSILASQCAEMGVKTSLVLLRGGDAAYSISDKVRLYNLKLGKRSMKLLNRIKQLHDIIKQENPNVLIPFLPIITLYTVAANIGIGKRIIMSERGDPRISISVLNSNLKDVIGSACMRKLGMMRLAYRVVFQTPDAQSYYPQSIQNKSIIIPNPLDTAKLPQRYIGERDKVIVAAGRFSGEKNFPMLLRAFSRFHENFQEYRLTVYGEGKLRDEYRQLIEKLGIAGSVDMPGFEKDLCHKIYNKVMYVSTSNHEGISNSMLEALGMGIPAIVTDCPVGGARMFVHTDENGILIPMEDEDALVTAMYRIASDPVYADRISCKAVQIRNRLSADKICEQWLELI